MDFIKELYELKAQYIEELKKAQAKCEVVDDLLARFDTAQEEVVETEEVAEEFSFENAVE